MQKQNFAHSKMVNINVLDFALDLRLAVFQENIIR